MNETLHVLCMIQNPLSWHSRYRNYEIFRKFVLQSKNVRLYTAEIAYKDHWHYLHEESDREFILRLRTDSEIWNKENAIDLLFPHLPDDAEYVAWFDADVVLTNPAWVAHTIELLKHYDVVQLFSHTQDLGSSFHPVGDILKSYYFRFVHECNRDLAELNKQDEFITGLAWASKISVLNKVGMLPDWCVFSSGDRLIAGGFIGNMSKSYGCPQDKLMREFVERCDAWGNRAFEVVGANVSYLPGLLLHYWHGQRDNRGYKTRWEIMGAFNPNEDIVRDHQGLYHLVESETWLREKFSQSLRLRNEDDPGEKLLP